MPTSRVIHVVGAHPESGSLALEGRPLVGGSGAGPLLVGDVGLSFWGGVDPQSGLVIDTHHPLAGQCVTGRVLAIPQGRGSCTGSAVLLELILAGRAPAAIIVSEPEEILTLGALVAQQLFGLDMPVLQVSAADFQRLGDYSHAALKAGRLVLADRPLGIDDGADGDRPPAPPALRLDAIDRDLLEGRHGAAAAAAMRLVLAMAALQGADSLIDVAQVHVDGCIYIGPASLRFAELLVSLGARVRVPTTLNAISVDRRGWRAQGIDAELGVPASALADAYVAMGARPTFTCAPYLLESAPAFGDQIGWAESNAVVYANSVIGARTMKYPDFLDICIALTGRAPRAGCHVDAGRRAVLAIDMGLPDGADDAFWPLAGYCCGLLAAGDIPLIRGLEASRPSRDDLKAFGAAFATVAAAPMFHIAGVTPEADGQAPGRSVTLAVEDLRRGWDELNSSEDAEIGLVSLGNPHFSLAECERLAGLVEGRRRAPDVPVVVTCGRAVHEAAEKAGHVARAEAFGVAFVTDTCWCMLGEPVIPVTAKALMTNSGKYAHYAPGLVGRSVRFGSLAACIEAACSGKAALARPDWL